MPGEKLIQTANICLFVCLFFIRHCQQEYKQKKVIEKFTTKYIILHTTTECTAGHPATMPSRMARTLTPKLTNQDSPLSLAIGASLFPMGSQERKQRPCRSAGKQNKKLKNKTGDGK